MHSAFTDLEFETKIYPIRISIFERNFVGAVVRVWAWDEITKYWQKLWSGPPLRFYMQEPRIFTPPLKICKFKTNIIRLELNYSTAEYYPIIVFARLFGTEDLVLPKGDIKDHCLINKIPEPKSNQHNLTPPYISDSYVSDQENVKLIIRKNYVIGYAKRKRAIVRYILNIHLNITLFRKFDDNDHSRILSRARVPTAYNRNKIDLNDIPVRKHNEK